jgi:hypothetical protein
MPVDTSIYNTTPPQPINPLAVAGQVAGFQNAQNQNRLFQQEFAANKAYGDIIQQSTDPATGQTDFNRANALAAQNPATAFRAPEFAAQAIQRQQAQTALDTAKLDQATKHFGIINNMFGALAAKPNLSRADFIDAAGDLVRQGVSTPQIAVNELSQIPANATTEQLQQIAKMHQLRAMDAAAQAQAMYGTISGVGTGDATHFVRSSPFTGQVQDLGSIQNKLSPGENAARIPTFVGGQPGTAPQSSLVDPTGRALEGQPVAPGASGLGTGRYPAQPTPAPSGGSPVGGPAGFVPSGPKLGAGPAADVTAAASANQGVNLQQTADSVPQRKALLGNLESALDSFASGPGADWSKVGKAFTNRMSPFGNVFDAKSIASQEEFAKQATQLAQSQFQALGGTGTDAKLDSAMHTSPNDALTPMGNKGIINMLKGNEDAIAVKNREWQQYLQNGNSPQDYGQFSVEFNKHFDPRVFQSVYMTDKERQDLLKGIDKSELPQFQNSFNYAVSRGWIPRYWEKNGAQ